MLLVGSVGLVSLSIVGIVYGLYYFLIIRNQKSIAMFEKELFSCQESDSNSSNVSFIVSAFNEAKVIGRKLGNIADLDYPLENIEVLVIDDASSDGTGDIANKKMKELGMLGKVITNSARIGLNRSLNKAMSEAQHNFICISDSDVILEKDALKNAVAVLSRFEGAGGVTGKLQPLFDSQGIAQANESSYRDFYDKSMLGESSLHSAFPGNGTLLVFDKSKVPFSIPEDYGATDANIGMNIVKSGFRFIYVPNAVIFEPVAEDVGQQRLQKVRRAKRLIQVFLHNLDVTMNKKFGDFGGKIFPLKLLMLTLCPVLFFLGIILVAGSILLSQNVILYAISSLTAFSVLIVAGFFKQQCSMVSSFVFHQIYLLLGFVSSIRKSVYWKTIERK